MLHTNFPRIHHNLHEMSGWENVPNDTWRPNMNPYIRNMRAPGHTTTFSIRKHTMLPDTYFPAKKRAHYKGTLFDLILTGIVNIINLCHAIFEHLRNFTSFMVQLSSPRNYVLFINDNQACKIKLFFGNIYFCCSTQY